MKYYVIKNGTLIFRVDSPWHVVKGTKSGYGMLEAFRPHDSCRYCLSHCFSCRLHLFTDFVLTVNSLKLCLACPVTVGTNFQINDAIQGVVNCSCQRRPINEWPLTFMDVTYITRRSVLNR